MGVTITGLQVADAGASISAKSSVVVGRYPGQISIAGRPQGDVQALARMHWSVWTLTGRWTEEWIEPIDTTMRAAVWTALRRGGFHGNLFSVILSTRRRDKFASSPRTTVRS